MDSNNWYENNTPADQGNNNSPANGGAPINNGGYNYPPVQPKQQKQKKSVTFGQLVACMLVMALISVGAGVLIANAVNANNKTDTSMSASLTPYNDTVIKEPESNKSDSPAKPDSATKPDSSNKSSDSTNDSAATVPSTENDAANESTTPPSSGLNISTSASGASGESDVVRNAMSGVVGIYIGTQTQSYQAYLEGSSTEESGSGAGVIITSDGYILTNLHVIEQASTISVYLQDGTSYPATVIGYDQKTDLAVLKVEAENLPAVTIGSSGNMLVGETVYAIGNPLGVLSSSVSKGIISGLDRTITIDDVEMTLMQTDAAVNPGNSGGGLFNAAGELVGIVNCKSMGYDVEGLGFAIPIDTVKPIVIDLIDLGYVTGRPYLGITMQNVTMTTNGSGNQYGSFGGFYPFGNSTYYVNRIQVATVEEGSAADKGGMKVGDIIIGIEGTEINGSSQLTSLLYEYKVGDTVKITVLRDNAYTDLEIVLGERTAK